MMKLALLALLPAALAFPAAAQPVDHSAHAVTPPAKPAPPARKPAAPARSTPAPAPPDRGRHEVPVRQEAPAAPAAEVAHEGHVMPATGAPPVAERETPPPPPPTDHAADRYFGAAPMNHARATLRAEHGGAVASKVMTNLFELTSSSGADGYRWDAEAWFGGDINRFVLKSEGEGSRHEGLEAAEIQMLYSRAMAPYTDVQVGIRHDFEPGPSRTYLTVGAETLLPYWFEAEGALFLSDKGDVFARLEGTYDFRLTQRLILQPRAEFNFAAQDRPATGIGSGLSTAELGLRLRHELRREFAPYVGVSYERSYGQTATYARRAGKDVENTSLVLGVRAWF